MLRKTLYVCIMRLKGVLVKDEKNGTLFSFKFEHNNQQFCNQYTLHFSDFTINHYINTTTTTTLFTYCKPPSCSHPSNQQHIYHPQTKLKKSKKVCVRNILIQRTSSRPPIRMKIGPESSYIQDWKQFFN